MVCRTSRAYQHRQVNKTFLRFRAENDMIVRLSPRLDEIYDTLLSIMIINTMSCERGLGKLRHDALAGGITNISLNAVNRKMESVNGPLDVAIVMREWQQARETVNRRHRKGSVIENIKDDVGGLDNLIEEAERAREAKLNTKQRRLPMVWKSSRSDPETALKNRAIDLHNEAITAHADATVTRLEGEGPHT
eukprot:TRINITY_DN5220_c0_g1_i1.p1 TRINITY_DN5220_c0_g1~~TRINITY_DN5220_c0_g1_i1.p1  ORF type:complete len:192 (-),score=34.88 TRINITY_DN5220_c0_g1_i1:248-823(-)